MLNQINNEIRSTLDIEEILTSACRLLGQVLQCSRVSILVTESNTEKTLVTRGEYNAGDYPIQLGMKVPITDNPHLAAVVSQQESLAVTKFLDFPGLNAQTRKIAEALEIKSMLAVATRYQGEVNGIIGLHQCDREREWTDWERQLLEGVGSQLAIAINQAKLYRQHLSPSRTRIAAAADRQPNSQYPGSGNYPGNSGEGSPPTVAVRSSNYLSVSRQLAGKSCR